MAYENPSNPYQRQASVAPIAFFTSLFTSLFVTLVVLAVTGNLGSSEDGKAKQTAVKPKVQQVPSLIGLTPEMAGDVVRARDLRLLVGGEQTDDKVEKGKIAIQDPMAGSDLPTGGSVKVTISLGPKQTKVPPIVGKTLEAAKDLLAAAKLTAGEIQETGEGDPGTVTDADPKPGSSIAEGQAVTLIATPSGVLVPDLVGMYIGKANKELDALGLKKGTVRWRYNEYRAENSVLSQEPAAGTRVDPGATINLVVNEEE